MTTTIYLLSILELENLTKGTVGPMVVATIGPVIVKIKRTDIKMTLPSRIGWAAAMTIAFPILPTDNGEEQSLAREPSLNVCVII